MRKLRKFQERAKNKQARKISRLSSLPDGDIYKYLQEIALIGEAISILIDPETPKRLETMSNHWNESLSILQGKE